MMTMSEIETALRKFLTTTEEHDSLAIGACDICATMPAAYEALDQLAQHRCMGSPSLDEALNSGDGTYHP